jgi:hypothetical protein
MGVFASKTDQLGADSFIPPAIRIQSENFLDNIGLFWVDDICTINSIIPQDISSTIEDPFLPADLLTRTNTLRYFSAFLLSKGGHNGQAELPVSVHCPDVILNEIDFDPNST